MDPSTYRTITVNDVDLEVFVSNEGGEQGLALLLHGFPESAFSWRYQIPMLVKAGYEVWAPNLRGFAGSSKPEPVSAYNIDVLLDDVAGLIDASGRDAVTLVGHNLGASIAWMFAIRQVRPLERLVIMNVPHPACRVRGFRALRQLRRWWVVLGFQIPRLPEATLTLNRARAVRDMFLKMAVDKTRFPHEVTDVYRDAAVMPGAMKSMINYYRASFRARRETRAKVLPKVTTPTLMLWGLKDPALSKETTDGTEHHVERLTIRFLPNVSHWVQQEAPEAVNAMISAWLDDREVPQMADLIIDRLDDPATEVSTVGVSTVR